MTDLPRVAVSREEAEQMVWHGTESPWGKGCVLRLPERPTMPCGNCIGIDPDTCAVKCHNGTVPIPEGTRVEVGWRDVDPNGSGDWQWVPVATATLTEVTRTYKSRIKDGMQTWLVTLTDVTQR